MGCIRMNLTSGDMDACEESIICRYLYDKLYDKLQDKLYKAEESRELRASLSGRIVDP